MGTMAMINDDIMACMEQDRWKYSNVGQPGIMINPEDPAIAKLQNEGTLRQANLWRRLSVNA